MIHRQRTLLDTDMQHVVDKLKAEETSVTPYRKEYRRLLDNHGKMLRAALLLCFGRIQDEENDQPFRADSPLLTGAAAIEMLHLATLVHDDVLDDADTRRDQPTTHSVYGNKAAIYLGDLILSRYMEIMASIAPDTAFLQEQAGTVCEIVSGELLQESGRGNTHITREYYERVIQGKTAALFRLACTTGVKLSQANPDPDLLHSAHDFGQHLGMAFQIIDDIGDFDTSHASGKPKLEDIRENIYTLPVIEALASDQSFAQILEKHEPLSVVDYLTAHPEFIAASKSRANYHIQQAQRAVESVTTTPSVLDLLKDLTSTLAGQL